MRDVRETNFCRISRARRPAHAARCIVFAAIDNLWKGTASQAVQNLNLMFGRARDARGCVAVTRRAVLRSRWVDAPDARAASSTRRGLPAGFRAARRRLRASSRAAASTSACSSATRRTTRQRRALHALRRARRAGAAHAASAAGWTRCARWSPTPATPTPRPASAGSRTPRAMQGAAAMAGGVREDQVARRLDRRDRRAARRSTRCSRASSRARARAARATATATSSRRSRRPTRSRSASTLEVELPVGHRAPDRAVPRARG